MDPWNPDPNPDIAASAPPPPPAPGTYPPPGQPSGTYPPPGQAPTGANSVPSGVVRAPYLSAPTEPAPVFPVAQVPVKQQKKSSAALNALLALGLVVAVGGIAFAAGRLTAPASASNTANGGTGAFPGGGNGFNPNGNNPNASFPAGGFIGRAGGGGVALEGTVTAIDANGITIKTTSGQEVTIGTTGSTSYETASTGSASDAAVGSNVLIQLDATTGAFGNGGGFPGGGFPGGPNASGAPNFPNASPAPNASPRSFGDAKTVIVLAK